MQRAAFRTTLRALSESAKASNTKQTSFVKSVFTDTGNIPLVAAKYVKSLYSLSLWSSQRFFQNPHIMFQFGTNITFISSVNFWIGINFWIELLDVMLYIHPPLLVISTPDKFPPTHHCVLTFSKPIHLSSYLGVINLIRCYVDNNSSLTKSKFNMIFFFFFFLNNLTWTPPFLTN
jgi:hypothetical protein